MDDERSTRLAEVFGCLHKQANGFLQGCAHNIWTMKGLQGWQKFLVVCSRYMSNYDVNVCFG